MILKFRLLDNSELSFNIYTSNSNNNVVSCSFNYMVNYLLKKAEDARESFDKYYYDLRDKYYKAEKINPLLTWDIFKSENNFSYDSYHTYRGIGGTGVFVNSFEELEEKENFSWLVSKILVTDSFGRIINSKRLHNEIKEILVEYEKSDNSTFSKIVNFSFLGNIEAYSFNNHDEKITPDIIAKNIEKNNSHFKVYGGRYYYFSKSKSKIYEFRKDPVPGVHYRNCYDSNKSSAGIRQELADFYDIDYKCFMRKGRKNVIMYLLDTFYCRHRYYPKASWKNSKYTKQWEKNSIKKKKKNSLSSIETSYLNNKKIEDKEYSDMMVNILIKQQGSISDWFGRLEKEEAGYYEGSKWIE